MNGVVGFKEWYDGKQGLLKDNPIAEFMKTKRNVIIHKGGDPGINAIGFYNSGDSNRIVVYLFFPKGPPIVDSTDLLSQSVSTASKEYLELLTGIINECKEQFHDLIWQQGIFDTEYLAKYHQSVEDIEEMLGHRRGFTSFCSNNEERLLFLKSIISFE